MLKFYLVTDTHLYDQTLIGPSSHVDQITLNESCAIFDAMSEKFLAQDEINILLIAGDLTNNGQTPNHHSLVRRLQKIKDAGKQVYVITATHDYGLADINDAGESGKKEGTTYRSELRGLYNNFGFSDAIAEFGELSYVVQLAPGYRLLCLNDDGNGRSFCGYSQAQLDWILAQIAKAKADDEFIFAMTHHPTLPPSPIYPLLSRRDMLGDFENTTTILADAGLRFIFTGHTHMQNINRKQTPGGNVLYDINTGSLMGYPNPIRRVEIDADTMHITTEHLDSFDWDLQGKTVLQYLSDHFDFLLEDIFDSMADDIERLAGHARGFGFERETLLKHQCLIQWTGRRLSTLTLGGLGRLLCCRGKIDPTVRDVKIRDLAVELVRNVYGGDEPYSRSTPMGASLLAVAARVQTLAGRWLPELPGGDLPTFVESIIYDPTPDTNADLPLHD